ncbi:MAG: glycosyltransferase, partial [Spirochaetia bacterium]|nr:glycosyltransferase [Spirochaetia bacterium]
EKIIDISISVVVYQNDLDVLLKTVQSVFRTKKNVFVTLLDNHSGREYSENLNHLFLNYKNVKMLFSEINGGYGYGHNHAYNDSPLARYHIVLNPDVIIHEGALEKIFDFMEENPDIGLCSPRILNTDGSMQYLNKRNPSLFDLFARRFLPNFMTGMTFIRKRMDIYTMQDIGYDKIADVTYLSGCFMFFRRSVIERSKIFFDEKYFLHLEDADITRRFSEITRCVYYPDATITHHWNRQTHRDLMHAWMLIRSAITYFNKWGWKIF